MPMDAGGRALLGPVSERPAIFEVMAARSLDRERWFDTRRAHSSAQLKVERFIDRIR